MTAATTDHTQILAVFAAEAEANAEVTRLEKIAKTYCASWDEYVKAGWDHVQFCPAWALFGSYFFVGSAAARGLLVPAILGPRMCVAAEKDLTEIGQPENF